MAKVKLHVLFFFLFGAMCILFQPKKSWSQAQYPKVPLTSIHQKIIEPADLRAKIVMIHFWFIGCKPCRDEIPGLRKLQAKYAGNKKIRFIAISMYDPPDRIRAFLKENGGLAFEQVGQPHMSFFLTNPPGTLSPAERWAKHYNIQSYPTNLILDSSGKIICRKNAGSADPFAYFDRVFQLVL